MADPTSDVGNVDEEDAPRCETCGEPIVEDPDHTVIPRVEDGQAVHYHFCGEECAAEWRE